MSSECISGGGGGAWTWAGLEGGLGAGANPALVVGPSPIVSLGHTYRTFRVLLGSLRHWSFPCES